MKFIDNNWDDRLPAIIFSAVGIGFWLLLVNDYPDVALWITFLSFLLFAAISLRTLLFVTLAHKRRCLVLILITVITGLWLAQVRKGYNHTAKIIAEIPQSPCEAIKQLQIVLSSGPYYARYKLQRSRSQIDALLTHPDPCTLSALYGLYRAAAEDMRHYSHQEMTAWREIYLNKTFSSVFPVIDIEAILSSGLKYGNIDKNAPRLIVFYHLLAQPLSFNFNSRVDFHKGFEELSRFLRDLRYLIRIENRYGFKGHYAGTGRDALQPYWIIQVIDLKGRKLILETVLQGGEPEQSIWTLGSLLRSGKPTGDEPVKDFIAWHEDTFGEKP